VGDQNGRACESICASRAHSVLFTVHYAFRIIAAGIKTVGRIPATVVRQIIVTAIHQDDGISSEPPVSRMYSDAEVSVTSVPEISMQVEMLLRLAPVAKDGRAVRDRSGVLVDTRTAVALVSANFLFAIRAGACGLVRVLLNVGPCSLTFLRLNALTCLAGLNVLFRLGFCLLLAGRLLLFVGHRLRADR